MIQTFSYRTETRFKEFQHTVYSLNIENSIAQWISNIENSENEVYSFDKKQVENIKAQFINNELTIQFKTKPYFLTYKIGDAVQIVIIDEVEKGNPDFVAKVHYLSTAEGGRKSSVYSGYRGHLKFDGRKELTSGEQLFVENDKLFPGDSAIAEIRILSVFLFEKYLYKGLKFEIGEGSTLVGHGEILEVINPILLKTNP